MHPGSNYVADGAQGKPAHRARMAIDLLMAERGLAAPQAGEESYEPIWCAWGYERDFTIPLMTGTLAKARELGLEWAVLDDGWQTNEGDWKIDRKKFARGDEDMKKL
ncbi:hypothetical protein LTR94_035263, partial [Friedmanniomyces endolithicus]